MKKALRYFGLLILTVFIIVFVYLALHNIGDGKGLKSRTGIVTAINGDTLNYDINFYFKNGDRSFYINRGIQYGYNIDSLKKALLGQEATAYFYDNIIHSSHRHLKKITCNDSVFYSEE